MQLNITGAERNRRNIVNILKAVDTLSPVKERLTCENGNRTILIKSGRTHVPDFLLKWCDKTGHYRVYPFYAVSADLPKVKSNYCMMNISDRTSAAEFLIMIQTILKNRGNRK